MNLDVLKKYTAYKRLEKDLKNSSLSHAYLVYGEDEEVMESFFKLAALRVFCPALCGKCKNCVAISENAHADIFYFDGGEINVRDAEYLVENAYLRPTCGDRKLFFIKNAEKLSVKVQNKLLKTYEDPPEYLTIFLGAKSESGLLNTIKSRGKVLFLEKLSPEDILSELTAVGGCRKAEVAAAYGMGNLTKARKFLLEENAEELYGKTFDMLLNLTSSSEVVRYMNGEIFVEENLPGTLDFMEIILSDVLKLATGSGARPNSVGRKLELKILADAFSAAGAVRALESINNCRRKLFFNTSPANCVERLLFDLLEARYKWQK